MSTLDSTHGILYPQLYMAEPGVDYSRFDRFHINVSGDGTRVDEVAQLLTGAGLRVLQHLPHEGLVTLHIDCIGEETGWIVTYDGALPHIGSISGGATGNEDPRAGYRAGAVGDEIRRPNAGVIPCVCKVCGKNMLLALLQADSFV